MAQSCESCGMPIDSGRYCAYCVDADGKLQSFDVRFEKMVSWQLREKPGLTRAQAEADTLAYMSRMPAWSAHPELRAKLGR